ncbi:MAG: efflux RND transporter periplasmic adaptor subunit [Roseovarius sp.]
MSRFRRVAACGVVMLALADQARASTFDCVMDPSLSVRLASPIGGILEAVTVDRGSVVSNGDVVARLSSRLEQATLRVQELRVANRTVIDGQAARLEYLERRLERAQALFERGAGTKGALEDMEAEVTASRNLLRQAEMDHAIAAEELERARTAISLLVLHSPIDGIIVEKARSMGEYLHPESHVATVIRIDPLHVETFLPVTLFGAISEGDIAIVTPAPPIMGDFPARVSVIDKLFDAGSGSFGVRLVLDNPGSELPAGHRCKVRFTLD